MNRCEDPVDHEILRRRYLLGERWLQIALKLPMDERNVRRRAARAVRKIWTE
nr:MAG TPA: ECF sigma factor [Caudoviricetes sp.]